MPDNSWKQATANAVAIGQRASAISSATTVTGTTPNSSRSASVAVTDTASGGSVRRKGQFAGSALRADPEQCWLVAAA